MSQDTPTPEAVETEEVPPAKGTEKPRRSFFHELPFLVIVALVLALLIKQFLVQAFYIPSGSMEHTLEIGDRVLTNKVIYHFRPPHRGEIVVFDGLDNFDEGVVVPEPSNGVQKAVHKVSEFIGLGAPTDKIYIKRVIGVAGDRVMCCDAQDRVVVTTKEGTVTSLDEPYLYGPDTSGDKYFCEAGIKADSKQAVCKPGAKGILVPNGRLWLMGDHRGNSFDSRGHVHDSHEGTVPVDKVVGRAFTIVYPFSHARLLRVPNTFDKVALPAASLGGGFLGAVPLAFVRRRRRARWK